MIRATIARGHGQAGYLAANVGVRNTIGSGLTDLCVNMKDTKSSRINN